MDHVCDDIPLLRGAIFDHVGDDIPLPRGGIFDHVCDDIPLLQGAIILGAMLYRIYMFVPAAAHT